MIYLTEALSSIHQKEKFSCGREMLDNYLHHQAAQDVKRKLSVCFILNEKETNLIKGYYTLSNYSIPLHTIPEHIQKKLPKAYQSVPTTLLGRLAVDLRFHGQGIGQLILIDALKRCYEISKSIGSFAVIVDPIDETAEYFYKKFDFIKLPDSGKMFLPMKTINQLFE